MCTSQPILPITKMINMLIKNVINCVEGVIHDIYKVCAMSMTTSDRLDNYYLFVTYE